MGRGEKKKAKKKEEVVERDRLSDLPDSILLHILCFIEDTKFCVQTSIVSRRWKNLWTALPDVILDRYDCRTVASFMKFVSHFLSRRENIAVRKFGFMYQGKDKPLVSRIPTIINYTVSRNVQHVSLSLRFKSLTLLFPLFKTCPSLKTLELGFFIHLHLLENFTLPCLTTLDLFKCVFCNRNEVKPTSIDPFVGLFNMKTLKIDGTTTGKVNFKISGPQLDSLTIKGFRLSKFEIDAPKLRFFTIDSDNPPVKLPDVGFPLLETADIDTYRSFQETKEWMEESLLDMINMFRRLYHARSLVLNSAIIEDLMKFPDVLEDEASPFVRLKTLKVKCYCWSSTTLKISDNVMKYFGENVTVEKL